MGMNEAELERVVDSLQAHVGAHFGNLWQPSRDRVVLGLSDGTFLLLLPRGPLARLHSVLQRSRNPSKPFSFQGACRAHLHGPLTRLWKVDGDRVVHLAFGDHRLVLRLTGRSGGLWLLHGETVVAAYDGPAPDRLPTLPSMVPRADEPRFSPEGDETWDDAARRWFTTEEARRRLAERRKKVARDLKRARDRARRLLEHLGEDLDRASRAPLLRKQADVLAAHLHRIERGAERVSLPDWEDPEHEVHIELDPGKPASATMETLYHRAGRLERVGDRVLERMDEVETRLAQIEEARTRVHEAEHRELSAFEKLVPARVRRGGRADIPEDPWDTWVGPAGQRVLVGRNAKSNRQLTFQVAKGDDFWMHLRGRPGAHLILPMKRGRTPPLELLLAAGQIALANARVPEGEAADVQYTRVRHVRAVPGETALVRVAEEKVLHVRRDPAALVGWTRE